MSVELKNKTLSDLQVIAKELGVDKLYKYNKQSLVDKILEICAVDSTNKEILENSEKVEEFKELDKSKEAVPESIEEISDADMGRGVLEILPDGYGFLRPRNYTQSDDDIYVSPSQIRRFNLRNGDEISGKVREPKDGDKYRGLTFVTSVNGDDPQKAVNRPSFDSLIPIYPVDKLKLEFSQGNVSTRVIDLVSPIGKGQRGMIVSAPKAGKTSLLKQIAAGITRNHPEVELIILLLDERPEEVTDIKRSVSADVIYSTFDETPENHIRIANMVLERAKRLVEHGKDVVILLDSLTRYARGNNLVVPPSGRTLSGGIDPSSLYVPKKFFGAARNIEDGGSLTILATALNETGSRMDDVIFEEFKGTGNMELYLDRKIAERRVFPAIDIARSSTRREESLLTQRELNIMWKLRKYFYNMGSAESMELFKGWILKTKNNEELINYLEKETLDNE